MSNQSQLVEISALWENTTNSGVPYLSGYLGKARIMAFRNKFKDPGDKKPDWRVFIAPGQEQQQAPKQDTRAPAGSAGEDPGSRGFTPVYGRDEELFG